MLAGPTDHSFVSPAGRVVESRAILLLIGVTALACAGAPWERVDGPGAAPFAPNVHRFDLGTRASAEDIARIDRDVRPDGEGLPPGEGTAIAGRRLYEARCRHCHGERGRGGPFDPLAGRVAGDGFPFATDPKAPRTIGSYWPFATTLFDYTRRAMPQERPGSLSDDEVYALTAYLLWLNDLWPEDATLDRERLPGVRMPSRDRFVPDDRRGGREIR